MKVAGLAVAITAGAASVILFSMNNRIPITPDDFEQKAQAIVAGKTVELTPDGTPGLLAAVFGVAAIGGLAYWSIDGKEEHLVQVPGVVQQQQQPTIPQVPAPPPPSYTPDLVSDRYAWVEDVLDHPLLLIYGASGSGKSTTAEWIVYERLRRGHQIKIFDPHTHFGQWEGLEVLGKGMDYQGIDEALKGTIEQIENRYKQRANQPNCNFRPVTCLCEEMTKWSFQVNSAGTFFKTSLSDLRKVEYFAVYVAHDRTLEALGGSKGIAQAKNNTLLELQLFSELDPVTRKLRPTGTGELKYPDGRVLEVAIPEWFQDPARPELVSQATEKSSTSGTEAEPNTGARFQDSSSELHGSDKALLSESEALAAAVRSLLKAGNSKSWIVKEVLGFKGRRYQEGSDYLEQLLSTYGEESNG